MDERNERTVRLADNVMQENVVALSYSHDFLAELGGLSQSKRLFDLVIVDCIQSGFFFTADVFIQAGELAKNVLEVRGSLIFVKTDKAIAIVKESSVGALSFHCFETLSQIYEYSPSLARQIQQCLGNKTEIGEESTDLSEQVLMSAVPVMTTFGIKLKAGMDSTKRRNLVLACLDNYSPLSSIGKKLSGKLSFDELLDELRLLEESGAIYPIFAKIPFLVHCFRNKQPFKLKDYLIEARLITDEQLDGLLFAMQDNQAERLSLGALCVQKGFLSSRQLEIALQDQAFYGQSGESEKVKVLVDADQESKVHSLVGHLGNTDPAGLMQSLATNRENGVLSVEHKDQQFRAVLDQGKITRAKQGKLKGNSAVIEFVSIWREGIFVFLERQAPADLADESCKVTKPLDKLLLDSALAQDNVDAVWNKLPRGAGTPLEKLDDTQQLLVSGNMVDPQEGQPLSSADVSQMQRMWKELDGLASVSQTIRKLGNVTTYEAATAVNRLLHYQLVKVPVVDLSAPLEKFQAICSTVASRIGVERGNALLRLSLQASVGYSAKARMFSIGSAGEIGVDLNLARAAGGSLTEVVKNLEDWQVKYIEYVSQELDKNTLRDIVYRVHRRSQ
jgi:hypothetical protein